MDKTRGWLAHSVPFAVSLALLWGCTPVVEPSSLGKSGPTYNPVMVQDSPSTSTAEAPTIQASQTVAAAPADQTGFKDWLTEFRATAIAQGVTGATYDAATKDISLNAGVLKSNAFQPEFTKQVWEYLGTAVSDYRITKAQELREQNKSLFTEIEKAYGVQPEYILAIWGVESSFGSYLGDIYLIEALATLGYQGRRASYGREQMIAAMKIMQNGHATRQQLNGSWAGAMGHTQFIPTTYLSYAVDFNKDGRKDLWNSLGDVFASTANYLNKSGWKKGEEWGVEVTLPLNFDYSQAQRSIVRTVKEWEQLGVQGTIYNPLKNYETRSGSLLIPAGHKGPAFIVFKNFRAIMKYNNSTSYALAVGHLAERIAGGSAFSATWPTSERSLSKSEREEVQRLLNSLGYDAGEVDGVMGAQTRAAVRAYQKEQGQPADGFISSGLLSILRAGASN